LPPSGDRVSGWCGAIDDPLRQRQAQPAAIILIASKNQPAVLRFLFPDAALRDIVEIMHFRMLPPEPL
jgi:hypothetical protein